MRRLSYKIISLILAFTLLFQQTGLAQLLPTQQGLSPQGTVPGIFQPPTLRYLSVNTANPSNYFNFLLDTQGTEELKNLRTEELNSEAAKLIHYFFLGLTLPSESFWVNLKPQEPERITSAELSRTDLGRTLLEQDLKLKKDMASYLHPKNPQGKLYWERLYQAIGKDKAKKATITSSSRVWIVPAEAVVLETEDGALVAKATLKVLLESEYLSLKEKRWNKEVEAKSEKRDEIKHISESLMKEIILPALTKEINESPGYAPLRQVYHSLILAEWYKRKHNQKTEDGSQKVEDGKTEKQKTNPYSQYINSGTTKGLESELPWEKQAIWQEYLKSYQEGEYKLQDTIFGLKRMYFSGGILLGLGSSPITIKPGTIDTIKEYLQMPVSEVWKRLKIAITRKGENSVLSPEIITFDEELGNQEAPLLDIPSQKGKEVLKNLRGLFNEVLVLSGDIDAIKRLAIELEERLGIKIDHPNEIASKIFSRYDEEYNMVVIQDEVMDILRNAGIARKWGAFNFRGIPVAPASLLKEAKEGDRIALEGIKHEHRHNDYHNIHGASEKYGAEQRLVDELYAYLSSSIDVYGVKALGEKIDTEFGPIDWFATLTNILIGNYIDGPYGEMLDNKMRNILRIKIFVAIPAIQNLINNRGPEMALEYLKHTTQLNELLCIGINYEKLQQVIDRVGKQFKTNYKPEISREEYENVTKKYSDFKAEYILKHSELAGSPGVQSASSAIMPNSKFLKAIVLAAMLVFSDPAAATDNLILAPGVNSYMVTNINIGYLKSIIQKAGWKVIILSKKDWENNKYLKGYQYHEGGAVTVPSNKVIYYGGFVSSAGHLGHELIHVLQSDINEEFMVKSYDELERQLKGSQKAINSFRLLRNIYTKTYNPVMTDFINNSEQLNLIEKQFVLQSVAANETFALIFGNLVDDGMAGEKKAVKYASCGLDTHMIWDILEGIWENPLAKELLTNYYIKLGLAPDKVKTIFSQPLESIRLKSSASSAVTNLAQAVVKRLKEEYKDDTRGFLREGKISAWGQDISFEQFVKRIADELEVVLPGEFNWEAFTKEVWLEARKSPQEIILTAANELKKQREILAEVSDVTGVLPGTKRDSELQVSGYEDLESIDDARRIGYSEGAVSLDLSAPDFQSQLDRYVELPAQDIVIGILKIGGNPRSANAYGPGLKGVFWLKDGVKYFTPLTIEAYKDSELANERLKPEARGDAERGVPRIEERSDADLGKLSAAGPRDVKQGGIDLSQIDLTLKDDKYVSSLNPADIKILRAAKALKEEWNSLSLLYIHELMLLLKDDLASDIQNKNLLSQVLRQLQSQKFLDPQAIQFLNLIQANKPLSEVKLATYQ